MPISPQQLGLSQRPWARQDRCALLSARVLLDPSELHRARLQAFLSLIAGEMPPEQGGDS